MTLSGPKDCRGSMKDARMRPHFLHSPGERERLCQLMRCGMRWGDPFSLTSHRRGQRVVEKRRHGVDGMPMDDAVQPEVSGTGQEECGRYGSISSKCSSRVS